MPPTHAISIWSDERNIYCELQTSPDQIITFPNTSSGLHQALELLGAERRAKAPEPYIPPPALSRKHAAMGLTARDLAFAWEVLKEMWVIR